MKKKLLLTLLGLLLLVGAIAGIKIVQIRTMVAQGNPPPPATVSVARVTADSWPRELTAVGSLTADQGVTVAAELPGKVVAIVFESGAEVAAGEVLLRQDTSAEQARLPGAEAAAKLARLELERVRRLLADRVAAEAEFDAAEARHREAVATVEEIRAAIAKKTLRAPFAGRLGIRRVNLGQVLAEGDPVVSLQALDPIHADFSLPQQELDRVGTGFAVRFEADGGGATGTGAVTAIDPQVDPVTRTVRLRATAANPGGVLRPGMYARVAVALPERLAVLAIPATAVLYAPYGDSVFVVEPAEDGAGQVVRQQFIHLGARRGDFVAVTSGLESGQTVVSTGAFKLRNGQAVVIDETVEPDFRLDPHPEEG